MTLVLLGVASVCRAQSSIEDLAEKVSLSVELSGTASSGRFAPLWLSANRQGLVSPYANSAYERVTLSRGLDADSTRRWKRGYCVDVAVKQNAQATFMVHQAYFAARWKKMTLTLGQKERETDLRNNSLSSGGLAQGINAQPVPQVLAEFDYTRLTDWWQIRGRIGFGMTTDGGWQKEWIGSAQEMRYTSNHLYHEKAMYWRFSPLRDLPLSLEVGGQLLAQFGGTSYNVVKYRGFEGGKMEHDSGVKGFINALIPFGSSDKTDGTERNVAGNMLGSYAAALTWKDPRGWQMRVYWEHMFEDHSQMFYQYPWYDHLVGIDVEMKKNPFVSHVLVEHMSTKDQSGPVYHDPTPSVPDKIFGDDNYYNHALYSGWQHWGMGMGNPLILAPIYNEDHELTFKSNRTQAWHIGMDGNPTEELSWKVLMSWTRDWGTYGMPYDDAVDQKHFMLGLGYAPRRADGWSANVSFGYTRSEMMSKTIGAQLTIRKQLNL